MRGIAVILTAVFLGLSCAPPPPIDKDTLRDYQLISRTRGEQFQSAAYLIDLRLDDDGKKFTVKTELYFSGDSVGLYGRGFLGRGAFKGNIIDNVMTIYFNRQDEYFSAPLAEIDSGQVCARPGEVLLTVLSLISGRQLPGTENKFAFPSDHEITFSSGRFQRTVELRKSGFPESEKLIDPNCGDSIVFKYEGDSRQFPFYRVENMLYYNEKYNFRARGFVREQKYNIAVRPKKFSVDIPPSATRLESL